MNQMNRSYSNYNYNRSMPQQGQMRGGCAPARTIPERERSCAPAKAMPGQDCCRTRESMMPERETPCAPAKAMPGQDCSRTRESMMPERETPCAPAKAMPGQDCSRTRESMMPERECPCSPAKAMPMRDCGCPDDSALPHDRKKLLAYLDEVSFGAYEALLYLDTHPCDEQALEYFRVHNEKRSAALSEYARLYGPLNLTAAGDSCGRTWEWVNQPWPWEGGNC